MAPTHRLFDLNGTRIHAVEQGQGPLVILIHGFPESWYSWRHQLGALAAAGYKAVAIDQRGYGRSSKFHVQSAYRIACLVGDIAALVDAYGAGPAVVVGHDWGAPVAWTFAWMHPQKCRGVVGMSVPFADRGLIAFPGSPVRRAPAARAACRNRRPGQAVLPGVFRRPGRHHRRDRSRPAGLA